MGNDTTIKTPYTEIEASLDVSDAISVFELEAKIKPKENVPDPEFSQDVKDDYDFSRRVLKEMIIKGQETLAGILRVAQSEQNARSYEVVVAATKNVTDMAKDLLALQEQMTKLSEITASEPDEGLEVHQHLHVTTAELGALIAEAEKTKKSLDEVIEAAPVVADD